MTQKEFSEKEMPAEIVETWEPVYKNKTQTLVISNGNIKTEIGKGLLKIQGHDVETWQLEEVVNIYKSFNS